MHELSLAMSLIDEAQEALKNVGSCIVKKIELDMGDLSGIEPEIFKFCFPLAAEGSVLEGAELVVNKIELKIECLTCKQQFKPGSPDLNCPLCRKGDTRVVGGYEFTLKSLEIE